MMAVRFAFARDHRCRRIARLLLFCATSSMLAACATNAPQAQFPQWSPALTTGTAEACDPGCSGKHAQTEVAPAAVEPPFEYQPYQGEGIRPTEAAQTHM